MENLEIEYKVMIDKKGYDFLLNYFKDESKTFEQINYYYDTKEEKIAKNGLSLRTRKINNNFYITLKESLDIGKLEHEFEIKENDKLSFPDEIIKILKKYGIELDELYNYGNLKTIRSEVQIDNSLLCIDHSYYNNIEDYEVECESNSLQKSKEIIEHLLNSFSIKYLQSNFSKTARFKKSLRK